MPDSAINWRVVACTVGGCWLILILILLVLGKEIAVFLNPFPLFAKAILGIVIYGYVGGMGGGNVETIFAYWTLLGFTLSWLFHKVKRKSVVIMVFTVAHLVLSALTMIPMMLINGR